MYNLTNNLILLPHQIQILKLFFASDFSKPFFLIELKELVRFYQDISKNLLLKIKPEK